jgi:hypothetical protein
MIHLADELFHLALEPITGIWNWEGYEFLG